MPKVTLHITDADDEDHFFVAESRANLMVALRKWVYEAKLRDDLQEYLEANGIHSWEDISEGEAFGWLDWRRLNYRFGTVTEV